MKNHLLKQVSEANIQGCPICIGNPIVNRNEGSRAAHDSSLLSARKMIKMTKAPNFEKFVRHQKKDTDPPKHTFSCMDCKQQPGPLRTFWHQHSNFPRPQRGRDRNGLVRLRFARIFSMETARWKTDSNKQ